MNAVAGYSPEDEVDFIIDNARVIGYCKECILPIDLTQPPEYPGKSKRYSIWECKNCDYPNILGDMFFPVDSNHVL